MDTGADQRVYVELQQREAAQLADVPCAHGVLVEIWNTGNGAQHLKGMVGFPKFQQESENPTIVFLLCADKNDAVVKITLPDNNKTIIASKY